MAFNRPRGRTILAAAAVFLVALGAGAAVTFYVLFVRDLPDLQTIADYRPPLASSLLDRKGTLVAQFFTERRRLTPLEEVPEHVVNSFVAAEDGAFFEHSGIDYVAILRAAWKNLAAGGVVKEGGSTITQQMVKGLLLTPERRLRRKIREMILARRIEERFTKQEILYLYLNQIYFGHGAYGIGEAAVTYYGKPIGELTVSEGAQLAGLPKAPSRYSPFRNPDEANRRRLYVLLRMFEDGFIDEPTYTASVEDIPVLGDPHYADGVPEVQYFSEEVRRFLFDELGGEAVLRGGLTIETSVNLDLQIAAVNSVRTGLEALDHRQGYRGPLRQVATDEISAEIEAVGTENDFSLVEAPIEDPGLQDLAAFAADDTETETLADAPDPDLPVLEAEETGEGDLGPKPGAAIVELATPYLGVVTAVDTEDDTAQVSLGPDVRGGVHLEDVSWARRAQPGAAPRSVQRIERVFRVGDVAHFVRIEAEDAEPNTAEPETDPEEPPAAPPLRLALHQDPIVQGGLLSVDIDTGEVLAMVGGYDFRKSQFNRVTQARRQPGSAFKPLIYGAALSKGYTPASILHDRPVVYVDRASGFIWRPRNYSRNFYGPITMREALVRSVNNATVHLFRDVGVDYVIDYLHKLGIESELSRDLSLALGSSGVSLLELTRAYAVYPAGGRRFDPTYIRRVTDRDGNPLVENVVLGARGEPHPPPEAPTGDAAAPGTVPGETVSGEDDELDLEDEVVEVVGEGDAFHEEFHGGNGDQPDAEALPPGHVISREHAYLVSDLMRAVVVDPKGTGWRLRALRRPLAGKTGTTNDQADAWFMGFSPGVMTGVWVGHDESRFLGWGETGSRAAAPIWVDFMEVALADRSVRDFNPPGEIVFARIDRKTGLLASAGSTDTVFQSFLAGTEPTKTAVDEQRDTDRRREIWQDSF